MVPALIAALIVCVQGVTGAVWWLLLRGRRQTSPLMLIGMGLALGTFAALLGSLALQPTPLAPIGWLLPTVVVGVVAVLRRRALRMCVVRARRREWVAGAVGLVAGCALIVVNAARVPLDSAPGDTYPDLFFFEALSRGIAEFGPGTSILMAGGSLRYHWFTYGWSGYLAQAAGTGEFVTLTRVLPVVALVSTVGIAVAWAARLSKVRWVPTLAALLIVAGGYSGALYGSILNFDSPSQTLTTAWLLAYAVAFLDTTRRRVGPMGLLVVAAMAAACTGGKISHAVVAGGATAALVLVAVVRRQPWARRAVLAGAIAAASMAVTYVAVLAGAAVDANLTETTAVKASTWQGLDPFAGGWGVVLGTVSLVLAILARGAGLGWFLRTPAGWRPPVVFATGGLLVGLVALVVLRDGVNDLWFVLAASAPAAIVSAAGVGAALASVRRTDSPAPLQRPLAWAIAIAIPASVACMLLTKSWVWNASLLNWLAPIAAWAGCGIGALLVVRFLHPASPRSVGVALALSAVTLTAIGTRPAVVWTSEREVHTEVGEVAIAGSATSPPATAVVDGTFVSAEDAYAWRRDGARWLAENLDPQVIVATSDPASAVIPALSGQQMFVAAARYQAGLGSRGDDDSAYARAAQSVAFADRPSTTTAAPLCEAGTAYAWMERPTDAFPPDAIVYRNDGGFVVRLTGWACPSR